MYFTPDELAIIKLYLGSYATPRVYVQQHMRDILPYVDDPTMLKSLGKILKKLDHILFSFCQYSALLNIMN